MSWGINEVDFVSFPLHSHGRELDSDATLLFDIHRIEHLRIFHLSFFFGSRDFEHPIGQRGFTVVDMSDDAEVSYLHAVYHREK